MAPAASKGPKRLHLLFGCVGNAGRSQMAHGWAQALGGDRVVVRSGGSRPAREVAPESIAVMREVGIDISQHVPRPFDEPWVRDHCDLVVTMGCGDDACPAFIGKPLVDWQLPDPKGQPIAEFRRLRDDIGQRVRRLLGEHGIPVQEPKKGEKGRPRGG